MPTRPLAYVINSEQVGGQWRGFVRVQCSGCGDRTQIKWNSYHNPNHIANYFRRSGWEFDPYRRRGIRCPKCRHQAPILLTHSSQTPIVAAPNRPTLTLNKPQTPDFSTFGKRLRWARSQVKLERNQLAEEAKINQTILEHIELGTSNIAWIQLKDVGTRLADILSAHGAMIDANWLNGAEPRSIAPAPKANPPKPAEPRGHPGEELRRHRTARGLSQGGLAALIYGKPGTETWTSIGSIQAMISNFERHGNLSESHKRMAALAHQVLGYVEPAPETPQKPAKARETLPAVNDKAVTYTLPAATAEALQADLRRAENDLADLRKMLEDLEPLRQMVVETTQRVDAIRKALTAAQAPVQRQHEPALLIEARATA